MNHASCIVLLFLQLTLLPQVTLSAHGSCPVLRATGASASEKTGCFIIVLNKTTTAEKFQDVLSKVVNMSEDAKVYGSVQRIAKAFTIKLSEIALEAVRTIPEVEFIEEETMAHGEQIEWHLDRIDQRALPVDNSYQPIGTGEGVDIYILDTGINYDHEEFEGRAKYSGYDPTDVARDSDRRGTDCHGHGTHVASLAGGKKYGSAKKARIYSVRVLNCNNAGAWSAVLDGIDHVSQVIAERGRPAVVSMSLGGSYTQSVQDAVQSLHSEGVTVVVAAGNGFIDACQRTPANSTYAVTVGGSANGDGIYFSTNHGQCVDIFAPGTSIRGADHTCETCSKVISGTSMSTPLVSGVAAIHLQREPRMTPTALKNRLISTSVKNALDFSTIPGSTTSNRHLYIPGHCGGALSGSSGSFQTPNHPSNYSTNLHCTWTIIAPIGNRVQLTFTSFHTETTYDKVNVCEGSICAPQSRWAQLSGQPSRSKLSYSSVGNALTVELITDGITEFSGFRATYTVGGSTVITTTTESPITELPTTDPLENVTTSTVTEPPVAVVTPQIINNCDADEEVASRVPVIVSDIINEASMQLQTLISDTLESLLVSRILGRVSSYPASSCKQIADTQSDHNVNSGYYWVKSGNSTSIRVFCDLKNGFTTSDLGWMRVALLNMTESNSECPSSFQLRETPKRTCGRGQNSPGCSSVFYSTHGVKYRQVCGRVTGYQVGNPNAFFAYGYDSSTSIDRYYVDGVSITRGRQTRHHIWTFAAARDEISADTHICPCTNSRGTLSTSPIPPYVGENYFCETGSVTTPTSGVFYADDPLWDGFGCGAGSSCCSETNPPYFCVDLGEDYSDDIELRICGNEYRSSEDTPIELVELYVR